MPKPTQKQLQLALPVLDRCREQLFSRRQFSAQVLDQELQDLWNIGYQELKAYMIGLLKHGRYQEVAAHYMETMNGNVGVVSEFQQPLADLYGVRSWYHSPDRDAKRAAYWAAAFGDPPPEGGTKEESGD